MNSSAMYSKGKEFEKNKDTGERKNKGVFYTPEDVVSYMVDEVLKDIDLSINPYIKILDPSCGVGYFLIKCVEYLERKYISHMDKIILQFPQLKDEFENIGIRRFIIENNIWGADIDIEAVKIITENLWDCAKQECKVNIYCCDSLTKGYEDYNGEKKCSSGIWDNRYDFIIGNPPYIGHKSVNIEYKKQLQKIYQDIYKDKSDLSYCFFKRGIDILKEEGVLCFITSRYFMEGPSAEGLRRYIIEKCNIKEIVDFNGYNIFNDAKIAACIIVINKSVFHQNTKVKLLKKSKRRIKNNITDENNYSKFTIDKQMLKPLGWRLIPDEHNEIYNLVEQKGNYSLKELFYSFQGIITGCDKAFVVDSEAIETNNLEKSLIKKWIKNSNVSKHKISYSNLYLIYTDNIENPEQYPNSIQYIQEYRQKLVQRRECRNGIREWYKLQWGRRSNLFEEKKLVYPYKSSTNRFAIDEEGYFCSADVYCLKLRERFENEICYEVIAAILNSKLFEFYFKCFAKKIGDNMYDYYPNTVLRIRIDINSITENLMLKSMELSICKNEGERNRIIESINREVYSIYGLNNKQVSLIENEGCD